MVDGILTLGDRTKSNTYSLRIAVPKQAQRGDDDVTKASDGLAELLEVLHDSVLSVCSDRKTVSTLVRCS